MYSKLIRFAAVLLLSLSAAPALRAADAATGGLAPVMREKFLNQAEAALRVQAKVSPDFWAWLDQRPQIRAGLLSAADPVPPEFLETLDGLRQALGATNADRYANLLLGAALGECSAQRQKKGGDGAYRATADSTARPDADPRVAKVADYLKQKRMSVVEFIGQSDAVLKELGLPPLKPREQGAFLNQLALATGTYPPHEIQPLAAELKTAIAHYETQLPSFADKGPQWPLFPLAAAPWPLLAPMCQTVSAREQAYLWDRFTGKIPSDGKRLVTYTRYTWDYEKPEVRFKQSDWNPNAIPRLIADGGVCGRESTMSQLSQVALGRPAVGMYQPGHRALLTYHYDEKTGHYSAPREQGITTADKSTCQWFLPAPLGSRVRENGRVVGVEYHVALALAMNLGLDRYTDSRIAFWLAQRLPVTERAQKTALLESAVNLNPYDLDPWFALAQSKGADTAAVNQLLAQLDKLLAAPDSGLAQETELAADTDLSQRAATPQTAGQRRESNLVADQVGGAILLAAYQPALANKASLDQNRDLLRAEVLRRAQLKLPYDPSVQELVCRYDVAADGPAQTQQAIAAQIKNLASQKPRERKPQAEALQDYTGVVLAALPQAAERAAWLRGLCASYPADLRFKLGKDGKAAPEPLYGYLQKELLKALKATGKPGVTASQQQAAEFEAARANFESQAKKT